MKIFFISVIIGFGVITLGFYIIPYPKVVIGDDIFAVILARTSEEQGVGLSGRESLSKDTGMLFIYPEGGVRQFWMKDMRFPIDIIWIDAGKRIVGVVADAKPEDVPRVYDSPENIQYVLEMNAGEFRAREIQVGDVVLFEDIE